MVIGTSKIIKKIHTPQDEARTAGCGPFDSIGGGFPQRNAGIIAKIIIILTLFYHRHLFDQVKPNIPWKNSHSQYLLSYLLNLIKILKNFESYMVSK